MNHAPPLTAIPNADGDPSLPQRRASDPLASAWVAASAGSGKTKVLTDRVLRLLLPRADGRAATPADKILCITFTKAAAAEMALRIQRTLGVWAICSDDDLRRALKDLNGETPDDDLLRAARKLFAAVMDAPGGLKIMTIHSFCQSVLGRFPVEAGLPPHFRLIEEVQASSLLRAARDDIIRRAQAAPDTLLGQSMRLIAGAQNEEQTGGLLTALCGERRQIHDLMRRYGGSAALTEAIYKTLGVTPGLTPEEIVAQACADGAFAEDDLRRACAALACGTDKVQAAGLALQIFLDTRADQRPALFESYNALFLTEGRPRKKISTKGATDAWPDCEAVLQREAERLVAVADHVRAAQCARHTAALLIVGEAIIHAYDNAKKAQAVLDFDDLIVTTLDLLQGRTMSHCFGGLNAADMSRWVMYKLDQGIDHILIDEAQDTNPEQWDIVRQLSADFFSGAAARPDDLVRTVFAVGDEKQSIYSFQRAAPEAFREQRAFFDALTRQGGFLFRPESLQVSFRSTETVLSLVDRSFATPDDLRSLGFQAGQVLRHISHRRGQSGLVELWPVIAPGDEPDDQRAWTLPTAPREGADPASRMAAHIAAEIRGWLDRGDILSSRGRPVQPGDILILLRTRSAFLHQLVRALKAAGVPVSGVDRMVLNDQIVVQDLMAAAQFALLPDHDLTLACVLKSPFCGLNDDDLFALCHGRSGSLWAALRASPGHAALTAWLSALVTRAASTPAYEFFAGLVYQPCPQSGKSGLEALLKRLGEDALEPLEEFLNRALAHERDNLPGLQGFLHMQQSDDSQIKRELGEAGGRVRIMTVHGSKGLQAPIVILPDTLRTASSRKPDRLLWPSRTGLRVPLWSPRKDGECAVFAQAAAAVGQQADEEYRRLLYVALTRAEDRLYVGGYGGRKASLPDSWYYAVRAGFDTLADCVSLPWPLAEGEHITRCASAQTADPDRQDRAGNGTSGTEGAESPPWLYAPVAAEPSPPRPLVPSRPDEDDQPASSPLAATDNGRFRRGIVTHRLLQFLPGLPPDAREGAARAFVARSGFGLSDPVRDSIVRETLAILSHPEFAPLFGPGSLAEVPVTGLIHGVQLVSGQIDRLLVRADGIWIVDYKTNRPPPRDPTAIPAVYHSQMKAYRDILSGIYPNRPIHCALIWTDGPFLMRVPDL